MPWKREGEEVEVFLPCFSSSTFSSKRPQTNAKGSMGASSTTGVLEGRACDHCVGTGWEVTNDDVEQR